MGLSGVEIFTNSSGSHHSLRKLDTRIDLILEATRKSGGIYLYSNARGCGGERLYYDGCSMIIVNGEIVAQGSQFSLKDVEVITATVDLEEVRAFRFTPSRGMQAIQAPAHERIETLFSLSKDSPTMAPTKKQRPRYHLPEEEIALGPACYLFDYLRRSGTAGFLLPLSGGIDSCATAVIVHSMCRLAMQAVEEGDEQVIRDVKRMTRHSAEMPKTPQELSNQIFFVSCCTRFPKAGGAVLRSQQLRIHALDNFHGNEDPVKFRDKGPRQKISKRHWGKPSRRRHRQHLRLLQGALRGRYRL